jgi:hypothetical protein
MPARRRIAVIALAVLAGIGVLLAFSPTGALSRAAIHDFFFFRLPRNLAEVGTPLGGERVLPLPVQHMVALLRRNKVDRYSASPGILGDARYEERILEGAWPIRRAADSPWYLALSEETLPAGCRSVDRQEDALLARCP